MLSDLRAREAREILCVYEKDEQFWNFWRAAFASGDTVEVLNAEYDETITLRSNGRPCTSETCHAPHLVRSPPRSS